MSGNNSCSLTSPDGALYLYQGQISQRVSELLSRLDFLLKFSKGHKNSIKNVGGVTVLHSLLIARLCFIFVSIFAKVGKMPANMSIFCAGGIHQ